MKTGAHFQQRSNTPADFCASARGFGYARENPEQRALAGAIATNDADQVTTIDLERDIVECPDVAVVNCSLSDCRLMAIRVLMAVACCSANATKWGGSGIGDDIAQRLVALL